MIALAPSHTFASVKFRPRVRTPTRPKLRKDRRPDSPVTLKPALVSFQSAKQMHGSIKNQLETQTSQRWGGELACMLSSLFGGRTRLLNSH